MTVDLRPKWLNVTRSLQKAACKNNGIAVVSSQIVVNDSGDPVTWSEPNVTRLGPLSSQDDLIRLLASLPSSAYRDQPQIAQISGRQVVINKGHLHGITMVDWFVYLDNDHPYAILSVDEAREQLSILRVAWCRPEQNVFRVGQPVLKIHW